MASPGLGVIIYPVLALFMLLVLPWDIRIRPGPLPHGKEPTDASLNLTTPEFTREVLTFPCSGETCEAWLYMPAKVAGGKDRPPVVVLGHGMGAQKDMGLKRYGEAFARVGIASFIFDYRTFGGSGGEPRNWVSPRRHVEDWHSAVQHVQQLSDRVDNDRLALWGTSFGGGHVLVTAAKLGSAVKAVVSQVGCSRCCLLCWPIG
jgi:dipeptidyl aminopeptidase/acylaminoacyl peptidase